MLPAAATMDIVVIINRKMEKKKNRNFLFLFESIGKY